MTYFDSIRCPASPTGWIEIADAFEGEPEELATLSASALLAHPMARVLSERWAMAAELAE